jgi:ABC-type lipoprotein release transport system permease subunit
MVEQALPEADRIVLVVERVGGLAITILIGSFAALAAAMSMAGVFAVVSYLVARRQKEIALRRALGARSVDVVWLLSAQTLRWTLAGTPDGWRATAMTNLWIT